MRISLGQMAIAWALGAAMLPAAGFEQLAFAQAETSPDQAPERPKANRLAKETSPYLLMHAHNPVDWYPWTEEALDKARRENKLIFLSIGYSSCYWCHVMERESFMNAEIAARMNNHFVCIKVDREERPDVDDIYMTALQLMSGEGGWPLSMFLTPDAKPIFGGTYYPPVVKHDLPGFGDVLAAVEKAWREKEEGLKKYGERVAEAVRQSMRQRPIVVGRLRAEMLDSLLADLGEQFDAEQGGFGFARDQPRRPKFPEPSNLLFLVDRVKREAGGDRPRTMLRVTLEKMAQGGLRDHIGGGFHRYSTDRFWRIPHFEKMLYDNGQLATVYAEAFALWERDDFRRVVVELADFVLREMTAEEGGFYSALDAETDAEEGKFYVWTRDELKQTLSDEELSLVSGVYGIGREPNFEGRHVLLLDEPLAQTAETLGLTEAKLESRLVPIRRKLLVRRGQRERPLTDTKIITGWNGLMIRGLADAGRLLGEERYTQAAARAADFLLAKLVTPEGRLLRTYGAGQAKLNAYLDDYALLVDGLAALHRATGERKWLDAAGRLTDKQIELYWDDRAGGFFFTSHDHEALIARSKDPADGAIPSGNAVTAGNLLYLAGALERPDFRDRAEKTILAASPLLESTPAAAPRMAVALAAWLDAQAAGRP